MANNFLSCLGSKENCQLLEGPGPLVRRCGKTPETCKKGPMASDEELTPAVQWFFIRFCLTFCIGDMLSSLQRPLNILDSGISEMLTHFPTLPLSVEFLPAPPPSPKESHQSLTRLKIGICIRTYVVHPQSHNGKQATPWPVYRQHAW